MANEKFLKEFEHKQIPRLSLAIHFWLEKTFGLFGSCSQLESLLFMSFFLKLKHFLFYKLKKSFSFNILSTSIATINMEKYQKTVVNVCLNCSFSFSAQTLIGRAGGPLARFV